MVTSCVRMTKYKMIIVNKVTFYWKVEKFLISLPEFVWVIDKGMQSFKKIYQVVMKLNRFFCPPLFRKRPITACHGIGTVSPCVAAVLRKVYSFHDFLLVSMNTRWMDELQFNSILVISGR